MFLNGIKISGSNYFAIFDIVKSSFVLIVCLILKRFIRDFFSKNILPYTSIDQGIQKAISSVIWYFCLLGSFSIFHGISRYKCDNTSFGGKWFIYRYRFCSSRFGEEFLCGVCAFDRATIESRRLDRDK